MAIQYNERSWPLLDNDSYVAEVPEYTEQLAAKALEFEKLHDGYITDISQDVESRLSEFSGRLEDLTARLSAVTGDASAEGATLKDLLLAAHPVGSYYWSTQPTDPSTLFGGTWQAVEGRFIYATDSTHKAGTTGGEETHTLTIEEMPAHKHQNDPQLAWGSGDGGEIGFYEYRAFTDVGSKWSSFTLETGGGQAHNNMPPYEVAYCWKRTA